MRDSVDRAAFVCGVVGEVAASDIEGDFLKIYALEEADSAAVFAACGIVREAAVLDIRARVGEINRGLAVVGEGTVVRVELAAVILYAGIRRVSDGDPVEIEGAAVKLNAAYGAAVPA